MARSGTDGATASFFPRWRSGAAALYVVFFHIVLLNNRFLGLPHSAVKWLLLPFNFGHQAVAAFIVLSGFCLTIPVLKRDFSLPGGAGVFFLRRAWRILPPYYAAVFLTLILLPLFLCAFPMNNALTDMLRPYLTPRTLWAHLFLVQDTRQGLISEFNVSLWSISVEWRITCCFRFCAPSHEAETCLQPPVKAPLWLK